MSLVLYGLGAAAALGAVGGAYYLYAREVDAGESEIPERPTKPESTVGRVTGKLLATIPKPLIGVRETMFKRMFTKALENYHKTAGGDAIGINARDNQKIELEPVLFRSPEEVDEGEQPGWKVKGRDKVWKATEEGSVDYLGRVPVVNLEDDAHVEAGWLAPRIGHAIEHEQYQPVFTNPTFKSVFDVGGQQASPNALADGGQNVGPQEELDRWAQQHLGGLELDNPGIFSGETLIDLDSGDGYDGMRISASKASEWQAEHAASEQMQMQEDRGYLRGLAHGDDGPSVVKLLLICAAIILGALAIIELGPILLGGGGGGGINPLTISALGAL
jgi:hypothetical protein